MYRERSKERQRLTHRRAGEGSGIQGKEIERQIDREIERYKERRRKIQGEIQGVKEGVI